MKDDEIEKYWIQYLKQNCKKELGRIKAHYPLDRTLTIDLSKVLHNGLWQECIDRPRACMLAIEEAFQNGFYNGENKVVPIIRFISLPKKKPIRDLRAEDEGKLLAISCLVKRVSPVLPKILKSTWKCSEYHTETVKARYDHIEKPKYCRT